MFYNKELWLATIFVLNQIYLIKNGKVVITGQFIAYY
jgi:hypothetical protein